MGVHLGTEGFGLSLGQMFFEIGGDLFFVSFALVAEAAEDAKENHHCNNASNQIIVSLGGFLGLELFNFIFLLQLLLFDLKACDSCLCIHCIH